MQIPGARHRQQGHQARQQHQVADPFGQKGIPRTFDNQGLVIPGADDQIGAQGEQFENRITEEQGVGEHQGAEPGFEQTQRAKEARPTPIHFHVANGIDLGQHVQPSYNGHRYQDRFVDNAIKAQM